jgi:hypothetical protein
MRREQRVKEREMEINSKKIKNAKVEAKVQYELLTFDIPFFSWILISTLYTSEQNVIGYR